MKPKNWIVSACLVAVALGVVGGCVSTPEATPTAIVIVVTPTPAPTVSPPVGPTPPAKPPPPPTTGPATPTPIPVKSIRPPGFASVAEGPAAIPPRLPSYSVQPDLRNVTVHRSINLTPEGRALLAKNAFVVTPGDYREFFHLYENIAYEKVPIFVTTDSVLHIYHLLFDKLLRDTERERLAPNLGTLTAKLLQTSLAQYEQLKGTTLENAAKRNVAFFAVAGRLLDSKATVPSPVRDLVEAELKLIDAQSGMANSPIFGYQEDYTQYAPRGHYTRNSQMKAYFRGMMWFGRMTFLADPKSPNALDQTRSALLMVSALKTTDNGAALTSWQEIFDTIGFFVGTADDLTYYEYLPLAEAVFGSVDKPTAFGDDARLAAFAAQAFAMRPPEINSMVVVGQADPEAASRGFRFLGQRFVLDAAIFQQLIERQVKGRTMPKGLDVPAAMGSQEAYAILEAAGDTKHERYIQQMNALRQRIAGIRPATWTQNLYWGWLYSLRPLLQVQGEGFPAFMRSQAWVRKDLNTFLGSWAELKHDTVLYSKQVYAQHGDGFDKPPLGYVEPNRDVYARLLALTQMTRQGLASRSMLSADNGKLLERVEKLLVWLREAADKELAGQALSQEEERRIQEYGAELEALTIAAADPDDPSAGGRKYIESLNAAVIADVATDPLTGRVLEVGVGRVFPIYVVVSAGGRLQVNVGGVFSYYEFAEPMANRLTDEAWRSRLDQGQAPPLPDWTSAYRAAAAPTPTPSRRR